jgi:redox-sensitive bicupin YhaK (pirin superfamily)
MSGPVATADAPPAEPRASSAAPACVEITPSRVADVGRMPVRRALPRRERRTVGAWCFADHMGPAPVTETSGLDIGPHPHTGLQTVTWLLEGEVLHRDSLGTTQLVRAGQLNLMTAGHGVAHSEEATGHYRGQVHGVQLWVAQPERTRHGGAAFEHHAELPQAELDGAVGTVLVGGFAGATSPARRDSELVGVDGALRPGTGTWPLEPAFEYALIVLDGLVRLQGQPLRPGSLAYLGLGRDQVELAADDPARVLLLGGVPFTEPIIMWWNFVARTREEIATAAGQWRAQDPRFGRVDSPLARLRVPPLPHGWSSGSSGSR